MGFDEISALPMDELREIAERLAAERAAAARKAAAEAAEAAAMAQWRAAIEACAFNKSEQILIDVVKDGCDKVSAQDLAAALWLKTWLGDSDWMPGGRGSVGNL